LEQVTSLSGGVALFPTDVAELDAQYKRVLDELRRRYVLAYTSTNSKRDGSWRQVVVSTRAPGVTIRSAGGYYAPGSAMKK
jgi:hypothetical protein